MSDKHDRKPDSKNSKKSASKEKLAPDLAVKDSKIDAKVKSAAGAVQQELTPIRRSAGHAHTH